MIRCKDLTWDDMTGFEARANNARMVRTQRRNLAAKNVSIWQALANLFR